MIGSLQILPCTCHYSTVPAITDCSQTADNSAAVTGGVVVAVAFIISVTVIVVVVLLLRNRSGTQSEYVMTHSVSIIATGQLICAKNIPS